MITAIAIDDEPKAIEVIRHHAENVVELNLLDHFYNPHDALSFLKQNPVDLVFLDINMPNMSGMELLQELNSPPAVIFTTAYTEYAIDSYSFNAIDYLLKPFEFDRFQSAVYKVKERLEAVKSKKTYFFIKDGFKNVKIRFEDMLYVKGSGNYLDITTKEKVYVPRMTFTELLEKLPVSEFLRVHQSYLVNLAEIEKIEHNHICIADLKIPISNGYKELVYKRLGI